jgi:hypothetical protein
MPDKIDTRPNEDQRRIENQSTQKTL